MSEELARNMVGIKELGKPREKGDLITLWHPKGKGKVSVDRLSATDLMAHQGWVKKDPKETLKEAQAMLAGAAEEEEKAKAAAQKEFDEAQAEAEAENVEKEDKKKKPTLSLK